MLNKHATTLTLDNISTPDNISTLHFYQMSADWKDLYYLLHIWSHLYLVSVLLYFRL